MYNMLGISFARYRSVIYTKLNHKKDLQNMLGINFVRY